MNRALALVWLLGASAIAHGAGKDYVDYRVRPGDNLYLLAERYLQHPAQWQRLAELNRVADPLRLPPGMTLRLPAALLRGTPQRATVLYARAPADAIGADGRRRPLASGDTLREGEWIEAGASGFAALRLADGSDIEVHPGARMRLERLREVKELGRSQKTMTLSKGRVDVKAAPQPPDSRFDVRTRLAVTGVRGTHFGVQVRERDGAALTDVSEGVVEVDATRGGARRVAAGEGAVVAGGADAPAVRPLLPAPALDGAAERYDALPVVLALTPQPGEHGYRAQLADDDGFARIRQQWTVAAPRLRLEGLPDGIHYLRLRALDADDLPGVALEYRFRLKTTPVAPLPQAPVQDAVLPTGRIAVQCSGIPDAAGFLLQYGPDAGFTAAATRSERARDCRFELAQDRPAVLYWRVATLEGMGDDAERGPFSDASRLRVVPAPQAPVLTLESGERIQAHWGAVPDTRFRVQLARDLAFAELVADTTVDEPRVSFDVGARCRPYFIRLQAIDQYGLQSAFSPPRRVDPDRAVCDTRGEPVMQQDGRSVRRGSAG